MARVFGHDGLVEIQDRVGGRVGLEGKTLPTGSIALTLADYVVRAGKGA